MSTNENIVGSRISQICKEKGIKQKDLAGMIYVSPKTVSSWVTGKASIRRNHAWSISRLFPEYQIEWILGTTKDNKQRTKEVIPFTQKDDNNSCLGCSFEDVEEWEMPCVKCKRVCKDYYRCKKNDVERIQRKTEGVWRCET